MKEKKEKEEGRLLVATNRRAWHKYHIQETFEAGLSLLGPEVKSLRDGKASLDQAFARVMGSEVFLINFHIPPYPMSRMELDPTRSRKLLLHTREINKLMGLTQTKGVTLVPLEVYFKRGWAKVSLGVAKAKLGPDRREEIKKRDLAREMEGKFKGKLKL
jgi:SsrA-binding protein